LLYTQAFFSLFRLYSGPYRLYSVSLKGASNTQVFVALFVIKALFRLYSGSIQALFRFYSGSLKGASNTQVFVAFFGSMGLILWLWRKEVCPYSLFSLY
jgi:hypothetical protein